MKTKCPPGYKYDEKTKSCVPKNFNRITRFKRFYFGPGKSTRDWLNGVAHSNRKIGELDSYSWPLFCRAFAYAHLKKFDSAKYDIRKLLEKMKVDNLHVC